MRHVRCCHRRGLSPECQVLRLRIVRQPFGSVDGLQLDDLIVGFVYEIGTTIGNYLLAQGVAEPIDDDRLALVPPWSEPRFATFETPDQPQESPVEQTDRPVLSEAADRPPRLRRGRRSTDVDVNS